MAQSGIIRTPTESERLDMKVIDEPGKKKTNQERFTELLGKQELIAMKEKVPFASQSARDDWKDLNDQWRKNFKRLGYAETKQPSIDDFDFSKYKKLKNFEVLCEDEVLDKYLTGLNPGLTVTIKKKEYKYKGYSNIYRVMEEGSKAVKRAQDRLNKSRA